MNQSLTRPATVIRFWFETLAPEDWFANNAELDRSIRKRFDATLAAAARCELWHWRDHDAGRLAEIIVLDQFSRNIFRHSAQAFAQDALALALAQEAVALGVDRRLPTGQRPFVYMPYMHSESLAIHHEALRLFAQPGLEKHYAFEQEHYAILQRFGRYPHRNALLGRASTPAEQTFLLGARSAF